MIEFRGTYFDGKSSRAYPVRIVSDGINLSLWGDGEQPLRYLPLRQCVIAPPLGDTPRTIRFSDGAQCETGDTEAIAALEEFTGENQGMRFVNSMEINRNMAIACLVGIVMFVWIFTAYGIPFLAEITTPLIPPAITKKISEQTLKMLDDQFLQPSELDAEETEHIEAMFGELCREIGQKNDYRIEFRKSERVGANAFALPSGLIVMTDELAELAENDEEIIGVLVHEMAHVRHRHGMRSVLQNAGVFLIVSILVGDVTSITSAAATLPTLLIEAGYSRKFEREADREAGLYFIRKGMNTLDYRNILVRLEEAHKGLSGMSVLSTHPDTEDRVNYLQSLETSK